MGELGGRGGVGFDDNGGDYSGGSGHGMCVCVREADGGSGFMRG